MSQTPVGDPPFGWAAPDVRSTEPPLATAPIEPRPVTHTDGIPLRPLSSGEILDGTFAALRRNAYLLYLAAGVVCVQQLLSLVIRLLAGQSPIPLLSLLLLRRTNLEFGSVLATLSGFMLYDVIGAA